MIPIVGNVVSPHTKITNRVDTMHRQAVLLFISCGFLVAPNVLAIEQDKAKNVATSPTCATPNYVRYAPQSRLSATKVHVVEPASGFKAVVFSDPGPANKTLVSVANAEPMAAVDLPRNQSTQLSETKPEACDKAERDESGAAEKCEVAGEIHSGEPEKSTEAMAMESGLPEPARHHPIRIEESQEPGAKSQQVVMNFSDMGVGALESGPMVNETSVNSVPESNASETSKVVVEKSCGQDLIVHPPTLQSYNPNQYTFVVENAGGNIAREVIVEIKVAETAQIVAAMPVNSVFSSSTAVFRFESLAAGGKVHVHLNAVSKEVKNPVSFVANVAAKLTYEFEMPQGQQTAVSVEKTRYPTIGIRQRTNSESQTQTNSLSAALIRNPYVGDRVRQAQRSDASTMSR